VNLPSTKKTKKALTQTSSCIIFKKVKSSWAWWFIHIVPDTRRLRQEDHLCSGVQDQPEYHSKTLSQYDPAISLLGIYLKECESGYNKGTCICMFNAALFIAKMSHY
jgi:hypothetical protein